MIENETPLPVKTKKIYADEDKNTVLHYAAAHGKIKELKNHLENGHEIDPVNYLEWTPLMMAARNGHLEVVEVLIEKSANATRKNRYGYNTLLMAIASENLDLLNFILQHLLCGGISKQSLQNIFSPVSFAVLFGNASMVQYFITKGFCVNVPTSSTGITPMMFADVIGNSEITRLLLHNGGKRHVKMVSKRQNTPVHPKSSKCPPNLPPLIILNQQPFSPMPSFINVSANNNVQIPRKSSTLISPNFTPHISPIPSCPYMQQVFFPQNFSPGQFNSPINIVPTTPYCGSTNELLNTKFIVHSQVYSPVLNNFLN